MAGAFSVVSENSGNHEEHLPKAIWFRKTVRSTVVLIKQGADMLMTPKTDIMYLWRHQDTPNNSRKKTESFSEILFKNPQNKNGNDGGEQI